VASYSRSEAREWAMENFKGVVNVIIPSFTNDLKGLNEKAIRHDIRKNIELGFAGALMVSEVAITLPEYRQFFEISRDESHNRQLLVHHASWNNLADNIEALRIAEENGAEIILLSYPPNFYPESEQDIYDDVVSDDALGVFHQNPPFRHSHFAYPSPDRRLPQYRRDQG
jgi:4-hydroxy-tetrahydrodipicolinate synthase